MADKKPTKEEEKINGERELIWKIKNLEASAVEQRRKYDWQWLVRLLYVRGYHFANYNSSSNTVVFSTRTGVKIPINLVSAHLRGVRNQVTSFQPKWEVLPKVTTRFAFQNARLSGRTLDYIYDKAQIKRKIKEAVNDALIFSVGIWQLSVDNDGNVIVNRIDPFDCFVDPNVKSSNINDPEYGAEFVVISNQVPLDFIKKNKNFENTDQVTESSETASAEYKKFLLQVTKNLTTATKENNKTTILKQAFLRERDDNGKIKIRIVTYVDGMDSPLKNELTDDSDYPFEILQGDIQPGDLYGEAWIKHLIPINRVIDALESHIFEYNHFFAKGKWVIDKNSGVRVIVNAHGQIIEKNRGSTVTPVTVPPLPPSPQEQISNMRRYLEDISGVHDVSLGRLPGTIRSGTAIAELRQADSTNQSDLIDNLEDFLARVGKRILKLVAENWTTTKLVSVTGIGGKPEYFVAIGEKGGKRLKDTEKFKVGEKELPLAIIGSENDVRVQVGSWLAYTKDARQEKLKELFRLGAIDQKTYLQHAEFADIDGIIERTREERIFSANSGAKSKQIEKEYGVSLDEESLALAENELMLEGIEQHADAGDDHETHKLIHKEIGDTDLGKRHLAEHDQYMRWKTKMNVTPVGAAIPAGAMASPEEMMSPTTTQGVAPETLLGGGPPPGAPETFYKAPEIGPGVNI